MTPQHIFRAFKPELKGSADLPAGVIGQVAGVALVYDEIDGHDSTFARGALERTIRERVAAGKVKLYWDHGDSPITGMYDSDLHIGTVRSITDVQLEDGRWAAWMVADLMDVPKAHEAKRYLESVLASGGETGLSIGCSGRLVKGIKSEMIRVKGDPIERITEFPLSEISITSMQSVPDSEVLAVRQEETAVTVAEGTDPAAIAEQVLDVLRAKNDAPVVEEPIRTTLETQRAALQALLVSMPKEIVRAEVSAVLGDATSEDSDAAATAASDAEAEDSRTDPSEPQAVVYATMEERTLALRQSYA